VLDIAIIANYLAWSSKGVSHLISTHPSIMTTVVKQIQANIIGEGTGKFGEYELNMREKQKIQIYKIKHQHPLKPSHKDGKHQFPPANQQSEKNQEVW
jgi:hypothetical protein